MNKLMPAEIIENRIFFIRGHKVMIDRDLAELYQVSTKALNQAVKRNIERFPSGFMFQLTQKENIELVTNCDRLASLKHSSSLPYSFTEQGVAMLSSVLKSKKEEVGGIGDQGIGRLGDKLRVIGYELWVRRLGEQGIRSESALAASLRILFALNYLNKSFINEEMIFAGFSLI